MSLKAEFVRLAEKPHPALRATLPALRAAEGERADNLVTMS